MRRETDHSDHQNSIFWIYFFAAGLLMSYATFAGISVIAVWLGIVDWSEGQMAGYSVLVAVFSSIIAATIVVFGFPKMGGKSKV